MKKNSLLKTIAIAFLVVVVLSWIIPTGSFSGTTYTESTTIPVGLINLFRLPVMTMQAFVQYIVVFLSIGAFYGVLNKTGVYSDIVKDIAKKMKGKEKGLLIAVSIIFALIGSLTGLSTFGFFLVPFVAAILLLSGYDKMTSLLATVGALLVGETASIFGFSGAGYVINIFTISMTDEIITKIVLFILLTGLYVFFIAKNAKLVKNKKEEKIPFLVTDKASKKSKMPLIVIGIIFIVISIIGMYNWYYGWGIEVFNKLNESISNVTIDEYPILSNILYGITVLGYWGNYEFSVAILIFSFIISWIYNVKMDDMFDGIKNGVREIAPVAFYATMANVVFTVMLSSQTNMYATVLNWLNGIKSTFSIPVVALISLTGSLFYNDFYYLLSNAGGILNAYEAIYYPITGVLVNGIYGIMMMILPTSVILVAGLRYFGIGYTEWLKKVWKYLLEALIVLILITIIVTILI
ncbi:MAG: hypothetical protein IJ565_04345 [Bacilli bacterium]|nr:hypothetical protein [Bacilli bacterium]